MENIDTNAPLISGVRYSLNEMDYRNSTQNYLSTIASKGKKVNYIQSGFSLLVPLVFMIILVMLSLFYPTDEPRNYSLTVILSIPCLILAFCVVLLFITPIINKNNIDNMIKSAQKIGEINLPRKLIIYEDRIEQLNLNEYEVIPINEFKEVCELVDGLYIVHQTNMLTYIPARYFDKNSAFEITSYFQRKLGAKYIRYALMYVPDIAEYSEEPVSPLVEQEKPQYEFNFLMQKKDINSLALTIGKIPLVMVAVVLALVGIPCIVAYILSETASALLYIIGLTATIAMVFCIIMIFKSSKLNKFASKNMNQKYFDDHVTLVTEKAVQKINYTMIKSVDYINKNIRIKFSNHTFIYVPKSEAQSGEQFAEFEKFIREKIKN